MVKTVQSYEEVHDLRFDSLAIGPGLGSRYAQEVVSVMEKAKQPMVVDADALNVLSREDFAFSHCAGRGCLRPIRGRWSVSSRKRVARADNG
jgi:NAD(P)H-hydrate epimerase